MNLKTSVKKLLKRAAQCETQEQADSFLYNEFERIFESVSFGLLRSTNHEAYIEESKLFCSLEFNDIISSDYITSIMPLIRNGEFKIVVTTNRMIDGQGMGSKNWEINQDMEHSFSSEPCDNIKSVTAKAENQRKKNWVDLLLSAGLTLAEARDRVDPC